MKALATATAIAHHINPEHLKAVIEAESHWNYKAVSKTHDHGIAQINAPSHPEMSIAQMNDPYIALEYMASQWEPYTDKRGIYHPEGNARAWTEYRILSKMGWPTSES